MSGNDKKTHSARGSLKSFNTIARIEDRYRRANPQTLLAIRRSVADTLLEETDIGLARTVQTYPEIFLYGKENSPVSGI